MRLDLDRSSDDRLGFELLQAELSAGGVDVVAFFATNGGGHLGAMKDGGEAVDNKIGGTSPVEALDRVVRNQIYFRVETARVFGEERGLFGGVIHPLDEDILQRHHLALLRLVIGAGIEEFGEGIPAIDGHDLLTHFVGRAVERKGQPNLQRLFRQKPDLRGESAGGNGDVPRADTDAPRRVDEVERLHQVGVIRERLAHAHENEIVDARFGDAFRLENLGDDFSGGEISFPTFQTARAKLAAVSAADLGGKAEGESIGAFAEKIQRRGDEDAFDVVAGAEFPKELSRGVVGALELDELERGEVVRGVELLPKGQGQVGHFGDAVGALLIEPLGDLLAAILGPFAEIPLLGRVVN
jgi:hypothetical protein